MLHPQILEALGSAGHHARILVADANYAVSARSPERARTVYLNLSPGVVSALTVVETLLLVVEIQGATLMLPPGGSELPIHAEYRRLFGNRIPVTEKRKEDFYSEVMSPDTVLVIATGETRRFANVLLTMGVVSIP